MNMKKISYVLWAVVIIVVVVLLINSSGKDKTEVKNNKITNTASVAPQDVTPVVASVPTVQPVPPTTTSPTLPEATTTNTNININKKEMITIDTNKGVIKLELYSKDAPKTVENFVTLAKKGFYDGVIFHRIIKGFMIQGGDPTGTGRGGPGYSFADELNPNTDSYKAGYVRGTVAMANSGPDTNGSQFFIMHADYSLPHAYTIFGKVVSGMDVVDAIANMEKDGGDRPLEKVIMNKVTVEEK
ncbi:MAG: peptidylprolyl isomerase [bacterium]